MNPFSLVDGDLHVTTDPQSTLGIEEVETDPVGPGRGVERIMLIVHAKRPFLVAAITRRIAFAEPVNIVGVSLNARKVERIRSHPGGNGELASCADAVVINARDLDIGVAPVEP